MNTTVSAVKTRARALKNHLAKSGKDISLSEALEAISATENGSDWNRYQATLKKLKLYAQATSVAKEYPPHKVLACHPGEGMDCAAEAIFALDTLAGKVPVIVLLEDMPFPQNMMADDAGWVTIHVNIGKDSTVSMGALGNAEDIRGIVIKPIIFWHVMTPDIALALCMKHLLGSMPDWCPELLKRIGTVIFYGLHLAESSYTDYYQTKFPEFMRKLRLAGGDQQLLIVTRSDKNKDFMAMSSDDYKIIVTESAEPTLFKISGVERLVIPREKGITNPAQRFPRLFQRKSLSIEDICTYVGARSLELVSLPAQNEAHAHARRYVLQRNHCEALLKDKNINVDHSWGYRAITMYKALLQTLVFLEKRGDMALTPASVKMHSGLDACYKLYANEDIPQYAKEKLGHWIYHLPGFDFTSAEQGEIYQDCYRLHAYACMQYEHVLGDKLFEIR